MKKYIKPCAKTIKIDNSAILAGSDTLSKSNTGIDGSNAGGKRGRNSFIFEDDYED